MNTMAAEARRKALCARLARVEGQVRGLQRLIEADTDPEKPGAIGLLGRLGFQREGRLRGEWETHIGVRDSLIYGLLRDEWMMEKTI